jgi:hypothetical protein
MDIDMARNVARAAFRSTRELGALVPLLKEKPEPREYETYSKAIASAIADVQLGILNRLIAEHPALETEIEEAIHRTGQSHLRQARQHRAAVDPDPRQ